MPGRSRWEAGRWWRPVAGAADPGSCRRPTCTCEQLLDALAQRQVVPADLLQVRGTLSSAIAISARVMKMTLLARLIVPWPDLSRDRRLYRSMRECRRELLTQFEKNSSKSVSESDSPSEQLRHAAKLWRKPNPIGSCGRNAQCVSGLVQWSAGKEPQLDQFSALRGSSLRQLVECVVQGEQVDRA